MSAVRVWISWVLCSAPFSHSFGSSEYGCYSTMLNSVSFGPSVINVLVVLKSTYDLKSSQYLFHLTNIGLIVGAAVAAAYFLPSKRTYLAVTTAKANSATSGRTM